MSSCERTEELLVELFDREPSPREREALDSHLALCADCRETARQYPAIRAAYRAEPAVDVGEDVAAAILAAARQASPGARRLQRGPLVAALLTAAVVLAIFGKSMLPKSPGTAPEGSGLSNVAELIEAGHFDRALEQLTLMGGSYDDALDHLRALRLRAEALEGLEAWTEAIEAYGELALEFPSEQEEARRRTVLLESMQEAQMMRQLQNLGYSR